jgi:hypothetical protein
MSPGLDYMLSRLKSFSCAEEAAGRRQDSAIRKPRRIKLTPPPISAARRCAECAKGPREFEPSQENPLPLRRRRLLLKPRGNVGGGIAVESAIEILGDVADVRRRENVIELPEGVIGR